MPMLDWIRYSGAVVSVTVNPCHWQWVPCATRDDNQGWLGPNERTWILGWLMVSVRIWIDNGNW